VEKRKAQNLVCKPEGNRKCGRNTRRPGANIERHLKKKLG
jgi:hypothetical protein